MTGRRRIIGNRFTLVAALAVCCTTISAVLLTPTLPNQVAIHLSADGTPGNTVPRSVAVALIPVTMLGTWGVLRGVERLDPPDNPRTMDVIICSTMLLFSGIHIVILAVNLGYAVPMALVFLGIGFWASFVVGYTIIHEEGD